MTRKITTDKYFEIIKQNHKKYLEQTMVTHLELTGGLKQAELVKKYADRISEFRSAKERTLYNALQQMSMSSKIGHGALFALLGMGVGGAAYAAQKSASVFNAVSPVAGVMNPIGAAFSAVLGLGVASLAYQAWKDNNEGAAADSFEQFKLAMSAAGFTDERYNHLSAELVKLFHYRECILLGLNDGGGNDMRDEFKRKYTPDGAPFDEDALNIAVEVYFLDQLNHLFKHAFKDIYEIHDQDIKAEQAQNPIITWLKNYFKKPEEREKFTQLMQIKFMDTCLNFLEGEMSEPGFFAKHSYATASVTGLISGALALGIASAVLGGPIGIGIVAIGLVIACVAAVATYFAVNNLDAFKFKRSSENRGAIKDAIVVVHLIRTPK